MQLYFSFFVSNRSRFMQVLILLCSFFCVLIIILYNTISSVVLFITIISQNSNYESFIGDGGDIPTLRLTREIVSAL